MPARPLSATQEAEAQALAARVQEAMAEEVLEIARLLVSRDTAQLFGPTEFEVRDRVLRVGAQAYEALLAEKKTATRAPASSARTAGRRPSSRGTGPRRP
jgi:hypothetical protein